MQDLFAWFWIILFNVMIVSSIYFSINDLMLFHNHRMSAKQSWTRICIGKAERLEPYKSFDIECITTEFGVHPAGFSFSLVQYVLTMSPSLTFWMVIYILCYCMLKACNLLLILILKEVTIKRLPWVSEDNWDFVFLNYVERLWKTIGTFEVKLSAFCFMIWLWAYRG